MLSGLVAMSVCLYAGWSRSNGEARIAALGRLVYLRLVLGFLFHSVIARLPLAAVLLAGALAGAEPVHAEPVDVPSSGPVVLQAPPPAPPKRVLPPVIQSGPTGCHAVALTFDLCPVVKGTGWDTALVGFPA